MRTIELIKNKIIRFFRKDGNKQIMHLLYFYTVLFVVLIIYIVVTVVRDKDRIINNSYNKREALYASKTIRGKILSEENEVLAYSELYNGTEKRIYPYNNLFAHVVGYDTNGKSGIESIGNISLLQSNILFTDRLYNELHGVKNPGDSIVTSLNVKAQYAAYNALGNAYGAVVLMDAKNGYILSMVSKPDFNPNEIDFMWDQINEEKDTSRLVNRATQGLYPPGSTFKIITALEYLNENKETDDYYYDCSGSFEKNGQIIRCFHGISHGTVDFDTAFAKSCNSSFANITTTLNKKSFRDSCDKLLFNKEIPSPLFIDNRSSLTINESTASVSKDSAFDELLQTGIGQGKTSVTPYHMCLISSAIANDGVLMEPIIVKEIETAYGDHVRSVHVRPYKRLISSEDSVKLKELMRKVVTEGTATSLMDTSGYIAYGKTGSAEFSLDKSKSHAWFTGFAEGNDDSVVAISVIVEDGGSGGQVAAPIAKAVFDAYYN